jgi:hypothetical protein
MFENFVLEKIHKEKNIIQNTEILSRDDIINSELSDFSKNYLIYDFPEQTDKNEFLSRIEKSNKLYFNYVTRPGWTLLTFLFGNFESRPPNEIINRLNIFPFYKFYVDAISGFIKGNFQIFVTKAEAKSIIDETNKAIYEKLANGISNVKIKNFFLQSFILKYNDESNYNLESTIPYALIKIFLEDKSYSDFIKKFEAAKITDDGREISLKDIIKILTDKYNVPEKIEMKNDEKIPIEINIDSEEQANTPDIYPVEEKPGIQKEDPVKEEPDKKSETGKIYSEELIKANSKLTPEEKNDVEYGSEITRNSELKKLFDEKQFQKILEKVYNSDMIYREKSFNKLENLKTWKDASKYLKEIFKVNEVEIYNKSVVNFVNVLNEYFKNKE